MYWLYFGDQLIPGLAAGANLSELPQYKSLCAFLPSLALHPVCSPSWCELLFWPLCHPISLYSLWGTLGVL